MLQSKLADLGHWCKKISFGKFTTVNQSWILSTYPTKQNNSNICRLLVSISARAGIDENAHKPNITRLQSKILSPVENSKNTKELKMQSNPGIKNTNLQLSAAERSEFAV